jgi:hypothetical protein
MKREEMMNFNKPTTVLSVPVIEIEITSLAREPSRLAQHRGALSFDQFAVALSHAVHSRQ